MGGVEQIASLRGGRALVNKTLSTYFPDQLLPINSETHLRHFLKALGEPRASDPTLGDDDPQPRPAGGPPGRPGARRLVDQAAGAAAVHVRPRSVHGDAANGPIPDVPSFIAATLSDSGDERVETRRQSEDQARQLLDASAGQMSEEQARELLALFNSDSKHGKPRPTASRPGSAARSPTRC